MAGMDNPFLDNYYGVIQQEAARDQNRRESEAQSMRMMQTIDAMQEARRQRKFSNLENALKAETGRSAAGLVPGEGERAPVDYGELPEGFDPREIARIADVQAQRFEKDRQRGIASQDFEHQMKVAQEKRLQQGSEAAEEWRRAQAFHLRNPTSKATKPSEKLGQAISFLTVNKPGFTMADVFQKAMELEAYSDTRRGVDSGESSSALQKMAEAIAQKEKQDELMNTRLPGPTVNFGTGGEEAVATPPPTLGDALRGEHGRQQQQQQQGKVPVFRTPQEARASGLPPGSVFLTPDGRAFRIPR